MAKGLTQGTQKLDAEEEDLRVVSLSLNTLKEKIKTGEIKDASTCNALGLAMLKGFI